MSAPVAPGRWPVIGHTPSMARQRNIFTRGLREHGDVVQVYLGPMHTYFIASPELTHQVLVTQGPKFRKGALFDKIKPFLGNGLANSNGSFHLRQRRLLQPAFHRERIAEYTRTMTQAATELVQRWQPDSVQSIADEMQRLAATVVSRALFSTRISPENIDALRQDSFVLLQQTMVRALAPGFVEKLPLPVNRTFESALGRMRSLIMGFIHDWREAGVDRGDQLSLMLLAEDEETGERMSDQQVYDEVVTMLTGGMETTALALSWLFYELSRNPEIERRLHAEVDEVLGGREITAEDIPRLTYTAQVVNETLRRYPIWFLMRRALQDVELGPVTIPEGAEVIFSPDAMHHNPDVYPDPERFDPDRWAPERAKSVPKGAFIPFGGGTRQCIGYQFAEHEIVITVATVAARYRLVDTADKPIKPVYTTAPYPGELPMRIVPRTAKETS
ncbi:cytochrome P450 [Pseudonocardiaceae bacterium YIM PH 21723]|nr:cytochrome P450 [Pseudonocardiaceae bacterium YIM PH 21723]